MSGTLSAKGLRRIKNAEGLRNAAYLDAIGKWTIGYGHLLRPGEARNITKVEAETLLLKDLARFVEEINKDVEVSLNQNEFDALVMFVYNVGVNGFRNSTLLLFLNKGWRNLVPAQLKRWVHDSHGNTITGLVNRRKMEVSVWLDPVLPDLSTSQAAGKPVPSTPE